MDPKDLCNLISPDTLYQILVDLFATMKVETSDPDFRMQFLGSMEMVLRKSMIRSGNIDDLCTVQIH